MTDASVLVYLPKILIELVSWLVEQKNCIVQQLVSGCVCHSEPEGSRPLVKRMCCVAKTQLEVRGIPDYDPPIPIQGTLRPRQSSLPRKS